ncbi:hypothetical protein B9K09_11350 [Pseudomonas sp. M30-35]|nr:hypothetical protein B9K09_11350 [Pseudomonas sp. M30-35]
MVLLLKLPQMVGVLVSVTVNPMALIGVMTEKSVLSGRGLRAFTTSVGHTMTDLYICPSCCKQLNSIEELLGVANWMCDCCAEIALVIEYEH